MRSPPRSLSPARECGQQTVGAGTASSPVSDAHLGGPQRRSAPRRFQHRIGFHGDLPPAGTQPLWGGGRGVWVEAVCSEPGAAPASAACGQPHLPRGSPTRLLLPRPGLRPREGRGQDPVPDEGREKRQEVPRPPQTPRGAPVRPHPRWRRELTRASPPRRSAVPTGERGLTVAQVVRCTPRRRATWTGQRTPERRPQGSLCPPEGGRRRDHTAAGEPEAPGDHAHRNRGRRGRPVLGVTRPTVRAQPVR